MKFRDLKESNKIIMMAVLLSGACFLTYYYHAILDTDIIFTHLFYIPIVLASIWWKRRGITVAVLLGLLLVVSHVLFAPDLTLIPDLCRVAMFVVISSAVALLSEQVAAASLLYKTLASSSHTGIYILQDGKVQYLNQRAIEYTGFPEDELLKMSPLDPIHPDDREEAQKNAVQMLKGVRKAPYEFRLITGDGEIKWILETVTPIQFKGRKAILGNAMDITGRKKAEEALQESEGRFRILENATREGIIIHREGIIMDANESALIMMGYLAEEVIGQSVLMFLAPESIEPALQKLKESIDTPQIYLEAKGLRKDKTVFPIEVLGRPIRYKNLDARVLAIRDITERKQAAEALRESEEKYRAIIENMQEGYHEVDIKGNFTFFNESMCKMLGYEREEMLGMNNHQYSDEENTRKVYQVYNRVYRTGEPAKNFEWQVIRKDGNRRDIDVSISLIRDAEGHPRGFRGIARDITERQEKTAEIEMKSLLLDSASDSIFVMDLDGNFYYVNQSAYTSRGYSRDELMAMNLKELDDPAYREAIPSRFNEIVEKGMAIFESAHRRKDGSVMPVEIHSRLMEMKGQKFLFSIIRDITGRKQLEARLAEARKMEAIGKLASGAAHEIRNPLNIMSLRMQMLGVMGKAVDEDTRKVIDSCHTQITRITRILEGLDDFSKISEVRKAREDLKKIVEEVLAAQAERLRKEDISARIDHGEDIPSLMLDKDKIAMVITHLVSNAVDAMKGQDTRNLVISTGKLSAKDEAGQRVRIVVSDTGHGISETDKAQIFDPFFTTKDPDKGKGLGLAISYGIIQDHGGRIWVENNEVGGASFFIELPFEKRAMP